MKNLYLLRHGMTRANEEKLYCGASDLPLSERGTAELLSKKENYRYPDITGCDVVTSGMLRTEQTLDMIYGGIEHRGSPSLRELDFGIFELKSYDELKEQNDYIAWISGDNIKNRCPGGESGEEMQKRVISELSRLLQSDRDVCIVTHGGVIAIIMGFLFPDCDKNMYEWQPGPGNGYRVSFNGENGIFYCTIPEKINCKLVN